MSGLPHISSDVTRKSLAGVQPTQRASPERYTAEFNARTYAELARRAGQALASHGGAIADATFRRLADRRAFADELRANVPILFVECQAPRAALAERAARREHDRGRVSDADVGVVLSELESWEPLDEVPAHAHLAVRTDRSRELVIGDVLALLDRRLLNRV
jgi:predicted kinase